MTLADWYGDIGARNVSRFLKKGSPLNREPQRSTAGDRLSEAESVARLPLSARFVSFQPGIEPNVEFETASCSISCFYGSSVPFQTKNPCIASLSFSSLCTPLEAPKTEAGDQSADYVVLKRNLNGHGGRAWLATDKISEHNPRQNQNKSCILCAKSDRETHLSQRQFRHTHIMISRCT